MPNDRQLLFEYVQHGSEAAFTDFVRQFLDFVYSTALRRVGGNPALAEEVVQTVFVDVARQARRLADGEPLAGWLHRHTCFVASKALRAEFRRRAREQQAAAAMNSGDSHTEPDEDWQVLAPLLDQAMGRLSTRDREALVQRFLLGRALHMVGRELGISEDAAQKRVARALQKLRSYFVRRGIGVSAGGLATLLTTHAISTAPASLATQIPAGALTAATTSGVGLVLLLQSMVTAKLKIGLATFIAAALLTPLVIQHRALQRLRAESADLHAVIERLRNQTDALATAAPDADERGRLEKDHRELLRLRGEVGVLRQRKQTGGVASVKPAAPAPAAATDATDAVIAFTATLQSNLQEGQTVVTGGWATQAGKRTLVFVTPKLFKDGSGDRTVMVNTKLAEISDELLAELGLQELQSATNQTSRGAIMNEPELTALLATLNQKGVDLLASPSVTTLRAPAQIQMINLQSVPGRTEQVPVGPSIDVVPNLGSDGTRST